MVSAASCGLIMIASVALAIGPSSESYDAGGSEVGVKWVGPFDVVQTEHLGPYWSLGVVMQRVRDAMESSRRPGPMFVRFPVDSTGRSVDERRSEVGFRVFGEAAVAPPFERVRLPRQLVAFAIVEGRAAVPRRDHNALLSWAESHGYRSGGTITEVYETAGGSRTEIQLVLKGSEADDLLAAAAQEKRPMQSAASSGAAVAPAEVPVEAPVPSIAALMHNGDVVQVAERLLPETRTMSPPRRVWLGELLSRIDAAAKGIGRLYPNDPSKFGQLSVALARRLEFVTDGMQPVGTIVVEDTADSAGDARKRLMRAMDRLLGRIAYRAVNPDEAWVELGRLLEQVKQEMLQEDDPARSR